MLTNPEKCYLFGYKIPQYFFFVLSGALCDIVQWVIDYAIYISYPYEWEKSTICWTLSYTLSIVVRHYSHRLLVFGEYEGTYCVSLARTYATYATSIVLSMVSNHFIIAFLKLSHLYAWLITMLWTGVLNYFLLKASWKKTAAVPNITIAPSTAITEKEETRQFIKSPLTTREIASSKSSMYSV